MADPKQQNKPDDQKKEVEVTYMPGYQDPPTVKWRGHTFKANEPKMLVDDGSPDGHVAAARGNKFFRVGGKSAGDLSGVDTNKRPTNEMEYRAHVNRWVLSTTSVEDLIQRFARERDLRTECGVADEDLKWLGTIVEPRIRQMRNEEGLSDKQVTDLWARYGFSEQPWRA